MLAEARPGRPTGLQIALIVGAAVAAAAALGWLAGGGGFLAVLLMAGVGAVAALLHRPYLGVLLLVAVIPLESLVVIQGVTWVRFLGIVVFAAWFLRKVARQESWTHLLSSPLLLAGAVFSLFALSSALWAYHPDEAVAGVFQLARLLAYAVLIEDLVRSWDRLDGVARALVVGGLIAAVLTILQVIDEGQRRAGAGIAGNINTTSVVLMSILPLGFYLLRASRGTVGRLLGGAFAVLGSIAVVLTFSRVNLLLLPLLLLAMLVHALGRGGARPWIPALLGAGAIVGASVMPDMVLEQRARSILPYLEETFSDDGTATSQRGFHLKAGLAMFRDHPVAGVGHDGFPPLFRHRYQLEEPGAPRLYTSYRNAHSSHVAILAELGLVGFALWMVLLVGVGLRSAWHALRGTRAAPGSRGHVFVQMILYALLLHVLAYGLYYENQDEKILWTLLALGVAAGRLVRRTGGEGPSPDSAERAEHAPRPENHVIFRRHHV